MKQAKNEVFIEGILLESDIKTDVSKNGNKPFIRGEVRIQVDQKVDNQIVTSTIPVRMFAMKGIQKKARKMSLMIPLLRFVINSHLPRPQVVLMAQTPFVFTKGSLGENIFVP